MDARLNRLLESHKRIDQALSDELQRRRPDDLRARQLKKLKLRVKDLMSRLRRRPARA